MAESAKRTAADLAVDRIVSDLEGRKGLDDMWYSITPDTRDEIRKAWASLIADTLSITGEGQNHG